MSGAVTIDAAYGAAGFSGNSAASGFVMNGEIETRDVTPDGPPSPAGGGDSGSSAPVLMTPYQGSWGSALLAIGLSMVIVALMPIGGAHVVLADYALQAVERNRMKRSKPA